MSHNRAPMMPLPAWVGPVLTVVTVVTASTRSVDYLSGQVTGAAQAYLQYVGVHAWGGAFAALTVALLVTQVMHLTGGRVWPLILAHATGAALYAALLIAVSGPIIDGSNGASRGAATVLAGGALHVVRAITLPRAAAVRVNRLEAGNDGR